MDLIDCRAYCLSKAGVFECFPFDEDTLVFKLISRMYAIIPLERFPQQINLKCDPDWAQELREEYDGLILPGYHMHKLQWNTVLMENFSDEFMIKMIDHSYDLIRAKLKKSEQAELAEIEKNHE